MKNQSFRLSFLFAFSGWAKTATITQKILLHGGLYASKTYEEESEKNGVEYGGNIWKIALS